MFSNRETRQMHFRSPRFGPVRLRVCAHSTTATVAFHHNRPLSVRLPEAVLGHRKTHSQSCRSWADSRRRNPPTESHNDVAFGEDRVRVRGDDLISRLKCNCFECVSMQWPRDGTHSSRSVLHSTHRHTQTHRTSARPM